DTTRAVDEQQPTKHAATANVSSRPNDDAQASTLSAPTTSLSTGDQADAVKWRTGYITPPDLQEQQYNPVPPPRTRSKRGSFGRLSAQHPQVVVQRSTSMYVTNSNELISTSLENDVSGEAGEDMKRWSSASTPETEHAVYERPKASLIPPKPAPRRIDYLNKLPSRNKTPSENCKTAAKPMKRPVPLPRQSKLKVAVDEDSLVKTSLGGAKAQLGASSGLESLMTIAKTTSSVEEGMDESNEWTLRL
ncbi:unnamed protein product, partial [Gongylonema pulchrum]|uniref:WH2 domain-containing protein n=1 Tax=Gongylonema pulchrum TaxID=637853 RepID=A0A183E4N0_9BILA